MSDGPVRIAGGVSAGLLIEKKNPVYPIEAKLAHVSGTVILRAIINKEGSIADLKVISGPDLLVKGAVDAVSAWKYRPYMLNGQPVDVQTTIMVNFNLDDKPQHGSDGGPARIPSGVMASQLISKTPPVYPAEARATHTNGSVVLRALIGIDGKVKDLKIVSGPQVLQQSVLDAVKTWRYRPYVLNGVPTEVDTVIVVNIRSNGGI